MSPDLELILCHHPRTNLVPWHDGEAGFVFVGNTTDSIMKKPSAKSEFNRWWRCIELAREQLLEEGRDPYNFSSADFGRTFPRAEKLFEEGKG